MRLPAVPFSVLTVTLDHLLWGCPSQNSDMVVSWLTGVATPTSEVRFGTQSGVYTQTANGTCASYYKDNFVHHVVLEGLQPDTQYFYVCGDAEVGKGSGK